jgi:hypothetical protein
MPAARDPSGRVASCASCGSPDLYRRKAFPKAAGLALVAVAAAATLVLATIGRVPPWAIYVPLFLAAAVDSLLYVTTGDAIACYRCRAVHYGASPASPLEPFDLEHAEELRLGRRVGRQAGPKP